MVRVPLRVPVRWVHAVFRTHSRAPYPAAHLRLGVPGGFEVRVTFPSFVSLQCPPGTRPRLPEVK